MPVTLPPGFTVQGWLQDAVNGVPVPTLPTGEAAAALSADTNDFTVSIDDVMAAIPAGLPVPPGFVPCASYTIVSAATPDQPNVAVDLTLSLTGSNPTDAPAAPLVDTVTVNPQATQVLGNLWGVPVVAVPAAPA